MWHEGPASPRRTIGEREGGDHRGLPELHRRGAEAPLPAEHPSTEFNYPIDILGKWHGNRYRFLQRYRSGFPDTLGEEFDSPFARLDWIDRDRFDIQWFRHTGTWHRLYRDVSLTEALKILETDGILHPL